MLIILLYRETIYVLAIHHNSQDYRLMLGNINQNSKNLFKH